MNKNYYPTPDRLISKMYHKIDSDRVHSILEPSAGKGNIVDYLREDSKSWGHSNRYDISVIEIDPELQKTLLGKQCNLIDSDFLTYSGIEHFDLIIANFPFDDGDSHLHKALDIMFNGQIVCLINAETLKNPFSKERQRLVTRLNDYKASIEYIPNAFVDAERRTNVEVALVYVDIKRTVETELFENMENTGSDKVEAEEIKENFDVADKDTIGNLVKSYTMERDLVTEHIKTYYKNFKKIAPYLTLKVGDSEDEKGTLTEIMLNKLNAFSKVLKNKYWENVLKLDEIDKKLTSYKREEIREEIKKYYLLDFSQKNIRQFAMNIVEKFPKMIDESILNFFDVCTKHAIHEWATEEEKKSIHYFTGWKTNNAFRINKKVILPFYTETSWKGIRRLKYGQEDVLDDMDKVISYFSGNPIRISCAKIVNDALEAGQNRKIETEYFYISVFKKGTLHLEFKDEEILRRFNIEACKLKNFLPYDYSEKKFSDLSGKEQDLVKGFEGEENYKQVQKFNALDFINPNFLIEYKD